MTHVRVERSESVGTITLDRPERHNALDATMARDLRRAALGLARDEGVRVVVLRGAPGVFCSGVDLRYVREGGDADDLAYLQAGAPAAHGPGAVFKQVLEYLNATISEIRRAPKPVLAAVDGVAAAGGLGLALCCDLVVASERAGFEWAYAKTGLSGAESATFFLPRLVGLQRAARLALLGERVGAADALRMGLVAEMLPQDGFDAAVAALARRIAAGPARAQARMKALLNRAADLEALDGHLGAELEELVASADGAEFAEGIARFFDRKGR
jgi:2-(1,2-epoxy-1,2-dihydrophenyl)acetyl-CoA isomerase